MVHSCVVYLVNGECKGLNKDQIGKTIRENESEGRERGREGGRKEGAQEKDVWF